MCGIAGIIGYHADAQRLVIAMQQRMLHRGPDSGGVFHSTWANLAVRRLQIVDGERGDQPLKNEDGTIIAMLNGEIYNDADLRRTLQSAGHHFTSLCDTEVLVHGYEQWGIDGLLKRIDGMFAFVLLDTRNRRAYLARDIFGEKPLYYTAGQGFLAFSSEMQTMLSAKVVPLCIQEDSLHDYLRVHYVAGSATILKGVYKLQPGHLLTVNEAGVWNTRRYSAISPKSTNDSLPSAARTVRELVMKSVHERLRSDQPVGTLLSGGLDSSIITALAAKEIPGIPVFTAGFTEMEFDESAAARTLADHVGAVLHHHVLTAEEGLRTLPNVIASMDEPSGDQALLPLYLLARDAKASVRVLLTGDGADELFGGYDYYAHATQSKSLRQVLFGEYDRTRSGFPLVSLPAQRRSLLSFPEPHGWQTNLVYLLSDPLRIAQEEDIRTWLPDDLLMKTDKMTMASSIEARCPFLSPTLAAYALGLPAHYKRSGALSKIVLREAFPDLLPPEIHARPKRSFAVPISAWLRGPWRALAEDVFRLEQDDGCIPHACVALLEKHAKGEDSARLLYAILAYRMWFYEHARYSQSPPVVSALLSCCSKP